jgi:hypothetical protein
MKGNVEFLDYGFPGALVWQTLPNLTGRTSPTLWESITAALIARQTGEPFVAF